MLMNVCVLHYIMYIYVIEQGYISALKVYPQVQQKCFLSMIGQTRE